MRSSSHALRTRTYRRIGLYVIIYIILYMYIYTHIYTSTRGICPHVSNKSKVILYCFITWRFGIECTHINISIRMSCNKARDLFMYSTVCRSGGVVCVCGEEEV